MSTPERDPKAEPATGEMILDWPAAFQFGTIELEEGELPDGAILIIRTHLDGNCTRLIMRPAMGLDWITARGMLESALDDHKERTRGSEDEDDGEDDYSR